MSQFQHITTLLLAHNEDCEFMGITPDMTIYVAEMFHDDDTAHYALRSDGTIIGTTDAQTPDAPAILLPANTVRPKSPRHTLALNFSGPRHRGLREAERIADVVRPLSIQTRMQLASQLALPVPPPLIIGIAESVVLAEVLITPPATFMVCRRLRLACALPETRRDSDGLPYDYDTKVIYTAHPYAADSGDIELPPDDVLGGLPGVRLRRPMDCMVCHGHLFIADGGMTDHNSRIHIWKIVQAEV